MGMRKRIAFRVMIFSLVILLGGIAYYGYIQKCNYGVYKIDIKSECLSNNSVGNEWTQEYILNKKTISDDERIVVPLVKNHKEELTIKITEEDTFPDEAIKKISINIRDKEKKVVYLTVVEDMGRYVGNSAKWEITVSIKLVRKIIKN